MKHLSHFSPTGNPWAELLNPNLTPINISHYNVDVFFFNSEQTAVHEVVFIREWQIWGREQGYNTPCPSKPGYNFHIRGYKIIRGMNKGASVDVTCYQVHIKKSITSSTNNAAPYSKSLALSLSSVDLSEGNDRS